MLSFLLRAEDCREVQIFCFLGALTFPTGQLCISQKRLNRPIWDKQTTIWDKQTNNHLGQKTSGTNKQTTEPSGTNKQTHNHLGQTNKQPSGKKTSGTNKQTTHLGQTKMHNQTSCDTREFSGKSHLLVAMKKQKVWKNIRPPPPHSCAYVRFLSIYDI